jgi:hypothetical protein
MLPATSCAEEIVAKIHINNKTYALSITTKKSHVTNSQWSTGPFQSLHQLVEMAPEMHKLGQCFQ